MIIKTSLYAQMDATDEERADAAADVDDDFAGRQQQMETSIIQVATDISSTVVCSSQQYVARSKALQTQRTVVIEHAWQAVAFESRMHPLSTIRRRFCLFALTLFVL